MQPSNASRPTRIWWVSSSRSPAYHFGMKTRVALIAALSVCALTTLLGIIDAIFVYPYRVWDIYPGRPFLTTLLGLVCGGSAVIGISIYRHPANRWLGFLNVACASIAFLLLEIVLWEPTNWPPPASWSWQLEEHANTFGASFLLVALVLPASGYMTLIPIRVRIARHLRTATLASLIVFTILFLLQIWEADVNDSYSIVRVVQWVSGLVAVAGIISIPIIHQLINLSIKDHPASTIPLPMNCPRCNTSTTAKHGISKCTACGLRITIKIEEPRCACGYALYGLTADNCPECGRTIDDADKWLAPVSNPKNEKPAPGAPEAGS